MDMVVYYDSHPGGLRAMRLKGDEGTDWYSLFHQEAEHRGIKAASFMACEPVDEALAAKKVAGLPVLDFIAQRVAHLGAQRAWRNAETIPLPEGKGEAQIGPIKVFVDAGAPKDECVMVSRDANGDIYDAMRLCFEGADYRRKTEKLQDLARAFTGITPFFMAARRIGKSEFARAYAKAIEGVWNDARVDIEPPNNTPPGLLCVSPMDGRMGNRWMP